MKYKKAPLSEMSVALQFGEAREFSPKIAISLYRELANELPEIEIKPRINVLGGTSGAPALELLGDDLHPRWWFSSVDGGDLVQFQNDLVALNWRRRSFFGEAPQAPYSGFDAMVRRFNSLVALFLKATGSGDAPPVTACTIFYDNVWPTNSSSMAEVFTFWQQVGIKTVGGPEVKIRALIEGQEVGENARVDITAMTGAFMINGQTKPIPGARLTMHGIAFPSTAAAAPDAFVKLHTYVTEYLSKFTTDETRKSWND